MPSIIFIRPDGSRQSIEASVGESAMQAATRHDVSGILAECGGNAMCATCHVYVDEAWLARLPAMRQANSRLSCQIKLAADLDGLVLGLPDRQL
jgi:2Fe-2S ferredoxin